jgi:hypothetical protein
MKNHPIPHALFYPKDDAFYFTEEAINKIIEPVGTEILHLGGSHIRLQTIHKRDKLRKTILWLEHKVHATHSPIHKMIRFEHSFIKTPYLETPLQKIRKRLKHGI